MSGSNVERLAALQQQAGQQQAGHHQQASSNPPVNNPPVTNQPSGPAAHAAHQVLDQLSALGEQANLGIIANKTFALAAALQGADPLTRTLCRERYIEAVRGHISAPARLFDTTLAATAGRLGPRDEPGGASGAESVAAQGRALVLEDPEPWPDPVDGAAVLDDIRATLQRFLVLPESALDILALWTLHTYVFDIGWITPRLAITSPEKRCGKTLVLTLLHRLVAKPLMSANATPAAVFRCVERARPTLLIDEGDTFLHARDELRGVLNSGHQHDGCVLRTVGDDHEPRAFSTFAPCAIAMIGRLADTLADRAIAIRMARKRPEDSVERLRLDRLSSLETLRRRAARWAEDARPALRELDPDVPADLHDRAADNWRILLRIADTVGGPWPDRARSAAIETHGKGDDTSARIRLLEDLRTLLHTTGKAFSRDLVNDLTVMEDRPWPEWKAGKPLTVRQLARLLEPFGVKPKSLRIGDITGRGYALDDLHGVFERYLPSQRDIRDEAGAAGDSGGVEV